MMTDSAADIPKPILKTVEVIENGLHLMKVLIWQNKNRLKVRRSQIRDIDKDRHWSFLGPVLHKQLSDPLQKHFEEVTLNALKVHMMVIDKLGTSLSTRSMFVQNRSASKP